MVRAECIDVTICEMFLQGILHFRQFSCHCLFHFFVVCYRLGSLAKWTDSSKEELLKDKGKGLGRGISGPFAIYDVPELRRT